MTTPDLSRTLAIEAILRLELSTAGIRADTVRIEEEAAALRREALELNEEGAAVLRDRLAAILRERLTVAVGGGKPSRRRPARLTVTTGGQGRC
jgi:hypothetical protein